MEKKEYKCPDCGHELKEIGTGVNREIKVYMCKNCITFMDSNNLIEAKGEKKNVSKS